MINEDINDQLIQKAEQGSITAIQILEKRERDKRIKKKKRSIEQKAMMEKPSTAEQLAQGVPRLSLSGRPGMDSQVLMELDISEIERYVKKGDFETLPPHMATYIEWMNLAHDWYYKFKSKSWILNSLMAVCQDDKGRRISVYMASKVFSDMLSFFYSDRDFRKNSWMLYLAERILMGAAMAWELDDFEGYTKALERAASVLDKVQVDSSDTDQRLLERRPRFFITDAAQLGLPEIDRYALARAIDEMPVPEKTKMRLKRDLGTEKRDMLDADSLGDELNQTK